MFHGDAQTPEEPLEHRSLDWSCAGVVHVVILAFLLRSYQTGIASLGRKWPFRKSSANRRVSRGLVLSRLIGAHHSSSHKFGH